MAFRLFYLVTAFFGKTMSTVITARRYAIVQYCAIVVSVCPCDCL